MARVDGFVEPAFKPVRDIFEENFAKRGEVGAALCVYQKGRPVVDLFGGIAEQKSDRPWTEDTLCRIDSTTKAVTAICALMLVEQGKLDLDSPIADYWPEFAAEGKGSIPVRLALTHQLGLPFVNHWIDLDSMQAWKPFITALENQRPYWKPGSAHGYHAYTFGWIVGELIRRVSGRTVGQFVQEHLSGPLGLDLWIGLPESEFDRVAPVIVIPWGGADVDLTATEYPLDAELWNEGHRRIAGMAEDPEILEIFMNPEKRTPDLFSRPLTLIQRIGLGEVGFDELNTKRALSLEIPAANGVSNAHSHAKLYAALLGEIDTVRLLSPETVREAARPHAIGPDLVIPGTVAWGLGFMVSGAGRYMFMGDGEHNLGHGGANGTRVFADPDRDLAVAYTRNAMVMGPEDPRSDPLVQTIYDCVA